MRIDVWSDIACPWCYLGKRRLEKAIDASPHAEAIELTFHAYELDPSASRRARPLPEYLAERMGVGPEQVAQMEGQVAQLARAEGLPYTSDRVHANSFDLHRTVRLAGEYGTATQLLTVLYEDLFSGRANVYDHTHLADAAAAHGVPRERAVAVLASDELTEEVRADIAVATRMGVRGVPFTVLDQRLGIPGATSVEGFADGIEQAWERQKTGQ